jgi:predicted dehydrogenase
MPPTMSDPSGLSRRTLFLAAAAFAAEPAASETVRLPRRIRMALLGLEAGHVGEVTNHLARVPDVEVVALADPDPALRARFAAMPGAGQARAYGDYRQMLAQEKLDLVAINNNTGERTAAILACVSRGLDVLAERPLALSRPDLEKVKRSVAAKKVALGALFPMRFGAPYQAIKRVVADGSIGQVLQMTAQKSYQLRTRAPWFLKRESYGGTIGWIGIHLIDLMRWTSGREIRQVASFHTRPGLPGMGEMDAVTGSVFKLDNGGVATMNLDYLRPKQAPSHGDDRMRLIGTQGVVEYQAATGVTVITQDKPPTPIDPLPRPQSLFVDFLEATYNGKPSGLPLADVYRASEIALAAERAMAEGRVVAV